MSKDLRQTSQYSNYLKKIGWEVGKISTNYYSVKKLCFFGSVIKIQRPVRKITKRQLDALTKEKRAFQVTIEPLSTKDFDYYVRECGFRQSKSPSLPTKTIKIDLNGSYKKLLSDMHHKARYNIGLSKRKGVKVKESDDIRLFSESWTKSAKNRGMFLSQKREIKAIYKAFGKYAQILFAKCKSEIVGGVLIVSSNTTSCYMYAFSTQRGNKLFAPSLLVWESTRYAKKRGAKTFDFGGIYDRRFPLRTWKGFSEFKRKFGGEVVKYPGPLVRYHIPF